VTGGAPSGRRTLQAGPLSLELDDGGLRYLRLGERELVRRVYVAVRDGRWATIPMTVLEERVQEGAAGEGSFAVDLVAEHRQGPIQFRWKGTVRGDGRGTIRFEMEGEALSTFERNRIGICVLHPIDTCAGLPCRVRHPDGSVEDGAFPRLISPHQPFLGVRALSYQAGPGVVVEIAFEGDVFETEDQRNWSDDSFKTYSTPIDLPKPVEVKAGTRIQQAITVRLVPAAIARRSEVPARPTHVDLALGEPVGALPALGTTLSPRREPWTAREEARLRALRLAHLRVELVPSRDDFEETFARAGAAARALGLPLEIALWLSGALAGELERVRASLAALAPPISTVLVLPIEREASPPEGLRAVRPLFPGVPIAAGSNVHFTELDRNRAPASLADALVFPNCPTVHMVDDTTVAENLAALPWIAETARSFGGERPLGLSPVVLRPPPCPPPALGGEDLSVVPRYADARQGSLFLAGWTAAHLGRAAAAGFRRLTYYQDAGWRGLMYGEAGARLPADFAGEPGTVYPVYHVLADLAELTSAEVLALRSSAPIEVDGLAVRSGGQLRLWLANLTGAVQALHLPAPLWGGRLRRLDLTNVALATRDPEAYRDAPPLDSVAHTLVLGPHELARIDAGG
jgi:hypothetical protein